MRCSKLQVSLILSLIAFTSHARATEPSDPYCVYLLNGRAEVRFAPEGLEVNRMPAIHYGLNQILDNLHLTRTDLQQTQGDILLLGEGFSELLPALFWMKKQVKAVDIVYALTEIPNDRLYARKYQNYLRDYGPELIAARVQDFILPDSSQSLILSHMLLSSLWSIQEQVEILRKSVRALAPGGVAIFAWYARATYEPYLNSVLSALPKEEFVYELSSNNKQQPYVPDSELDDMALQLKGVIRPKWRRDHSQARIQVLRIERLSPRD